MFVRMFVCCVIVCLFVYLRYLFIYLFMLYRALLCFIMLYYVLLPHCVVNTGEYFVCVWLVEHRHRRDTHNNQMLLMLFPVLIRTLLDGNRDTGL